MPILLQRCACGRLGLLLKKQGMRAFQKSASFVESARAVVTATTNYPKIWRDILSLKDKVDSGKSLSSIALIAKFGYLVDAAHPSIRGEGSSIPFYSFTPPAGEASAQSVNHSNYRLYVEQHIYAFVWEPSYSETYHAMMATIAVAKVAAAIGATVMSGGAAAPSLIVAINAAHQNAKSVIVVGQAIYQTGSMLATLGKGAYEAYTAGSEARASNQRGVDAAAGRNSSAQSEILAGVTGNLDLAAPVVGAVPKQKAKYYFDMFGMRQQTTKEVLQEQGAQVQAQEAAFQRLNFIVVQQITPILQTRGNVSLSADTMTVETTTRFWNNSMIRVGETNRDKYDQLIQSIKTDSFDHSAAVDHLISPWGAEGAWLQSKRDRTTESQQPTRVSAGDEQREFTPAWANEGDAGWLVGTPGRVNAPLPNAFVVAMEKFKENARKAVHERDVRLQIDTRLKLLGRNAQLAVTKRNMAAMASNQAVNNLIRTSGMSKASFVLATKPSGFLGGRRETNDFLMKIDAALHEWEQTCCKHLGTGEWIKELKVAAKVVEMTCTAYINDKGSRQKSAIFSHHTGDKIPVVQALDRQANKIFQQLEQMDVANRCVLNLTGRFFVSRIVPKPCLDCLAMTCQGVLAQRTVDFAGGVHMI